MTGVSKRRANNNLSRKADPADYFAGDLIVEIGRAFLGAPYRDNILERSGKEKLVVSLNAFDCTTFVETVLALAGSFRSGHSSRTEFRKHLKQIRYRQGKISGYASRLHYFTDWLGDNAKKKIFKDVSRRLGGKPCRRKINFMTAHPNLYAALKDKTALDEIRRLESRLSRKTFYLIDKKNFDAAKEKILNGDIIAFAAAQEGLDVAHVGFAVRQGKSLHLLHASSKEEAVVLSRKTLAGYLKSGKKFTGIFVARLSSGSQSPDIF